MSLSNAPELRKTESRWDGAREVMGMSGPIILGSLSFTIMMFIDQVMVAKLGTDALAAIGSAGLWSYISSCFLFGIIGCVSTFVSQSFGRGNLEDCSRYTWQGLHFSLLGGLLALVLWPVSTTLFRAMNHAPEVTRLETVYFQIRLVGFLPTAAITALVAFFQAVGRPGTPTKISILANVVNVIGNYLLIYGRFGFPKLGVAGAAISTVLSLFIQAGILLYLFLSGPMNDRYASRRTRAFEMPKAKEILNVGAPTGFTFFMDVANWGIFTSFVVGHFGTVALASHNAAINFMHLGFMPAIGLNQGVAALVGQYIGRKDPDTAEARTYTAIKIAMVYMFAMGLLFAVFGKGLIFTFFSKDPAVLALGHRLLILSAFFQAFDAINIIASGALRGAGDTRWMAMVMFLFAYLFFLPLALALAFLAKWGAIGAWIGATAYIIVLSGFLFTRFRRGHWRTINIFTYSDSVPSE